MLRAVKVVILSCRLLTEELLVAYNGIRNKKFDIDKVRNSNALYFKNVKYKHESVPYNTMKSSSDR